MGTRMRRCSNIEVYIALCFRRRTNNIR